MNPILASVLRGQATADVFILNGHAHIGRNFNLPRATDDASALLRTMDAVGITASCVSSSRAIGPDVAGGNDEMLEAVGKYPDRFVGAAVVNPRYPDEVTKELDRVFRFHGVAMLKAHPESHAYPIDGPDYKSMWDFAAKRSVPVLVHTWGDGQGYDDPRQVEAVSHDYPDLPIVLAHAGGSERGVIDSVRIARQRRSVYLDTATSLVYRGAIQYMIEEAGPEKVVFGTDATYLSDPPQLAKVAAATDDMGVLRMILGETLRELVAATGLPSAIRS